MRRFGFETAIVALAVLAASCASAPPQAEARDDRHHPVTVSFGPDANTLLLGTCPRRAPDSRDCRVEMLDVAGRRSVAFVAPAGRYLQMPSLAADGKSILAVATAVEADETGNRAATIVRFAPDRPDRAEVVVDSARELLLPSETESGLAYWTKQCVSPTQRYCAMDPMVQRPGEAKPQGLGRPYGFRGVSLIFLLGDRLYANAEFPAEIDLDKYDVLNKEHTNTFWQLDATFAHGWKKVPQFGLAGSEGARDGKGRLFLLGDDEDGSGLFRAEAEVFRRVANLPDATLGGSTTGYVVDRDGSSSAMITLFNGGSERIYTSLLISTDGAPWRTVNLPKPARSARVLFAQR